MGKDKKTEKRVRLKYVHVYNVDDVYQFTAHCLLLYQKMIMQLYSVIVNFDLFQDGPVEMQI